MSNKTINWPSESMISTYNDVEFWRRRLKNQEQYLVKYSQRKMRSNNRNRVRAIEVYKSACGVRDYIHQQIKRLTNENN